LSFTEFLLKKNLNFKTLGICTSRFLQGLWHCNFQFLCQKLKNWICYKLVISYLTLFARSLLFSLFIIDISNFIHFSNFHINADDLQIYLSGIKESIASVVNQINSDLVSISDWSTQNGLSLNSQKTKVMAIHRNTLSNFTPVKTGDTIPPKLKILALS
jgi:hypothetical protein